MSLIELNTLRDQLTKHFADAEVIRSKYEGKKDENMTPDEVASWEKHLSDADAISKRIKNLEQHMKLEQEIKDVANDIPEAGSGVPTINRNEVEDMLYAKFLTFGGLDKFERSESETEILRATATLGNSPNAGYMAPTPRMLNRIIQAVDAQTIMLNNATVIPMDSDTAVSVREFDNDVADFDWTGENTSANETNATFGLRNLQPKFLSKKVLISKPLLRKADINIVNFILTRLGTKFGVTLEKAFMTGNGVNKPLGIFVASNDGISTARDVEGGTSLTIKETDLIKMAYDTLRSGYRNSSVWILHRQALSDIRQLKDSAGHYVWQPFDFPGKQMTGANPGSILGLPYMESEFAPSKTSNAWVAGDYPIVLGSLKNYFIGQSQKMEITQMTETYAETNKVAFVGNGEYDGMPTLEEAWVRLKIKS